MVLCVIAQLTIITYGSAGVEIRIKKGMGKIIWKWHWHNFCSPSTNNRFCSMCKPSNMLQNFTGIGYILKYCTEYRRRRAVYIQHLNQICFFVKQKNSVFMFSSKWCKMMLLRHNILLNLKWQQPVVTFSTGGAKLLCRTGSLLQGGNNSLMTITANICKDCKLKKKKNRNVCLMLACKLHILSHNNVLCNVVLITLEVQFYFYQHWNAFCHWFIICKTCTCTVYIQIAYLTKRHYLNLKDLNSSAAKIAP